MFESGEWIASVKNVVVSTGRNLWGRGGDYTVPLKMLIFELEGLRRCWAAIGKTSENFVIQVFLDIGVAPLDILDGYLATLTDREALGADKLERLHYIRGICEILQVVVREHSSPNLRKIIDNVISQTESLVVVGSQHAGEVENLLEVLKQFEGRVR